MCQVNTDPMRSRQGYLQVVGKYKLLLVIVAGCREVADNSRTL